MPVRRQLRFYVASRLISNIFERLTGRQISERLKVPNKQI